MQSILAAEVGKLADWGWKVESQTESTAALETRGPFRWWFFAIMVLLFPLFGGLLYVVFWAIASRLNLFVRVGDGGLVYSGDAWYVDRQAAEAEASRQLAIQIKTQGFWKAVGPSIAMTIVGVAAWVLLFWAIFALLD